MEALGRADEIAGGGHGEKGPGEFDIHGRFTPYIKKSNIKVQLISFAR
jgi:hypothetical protein